MDNKDGLDSKYIISELANIRHSLSDLEQSLSNNTLDAATCKDTINEDSTAAFIVQNGIIKTVNKQMREITGYAENDLVGISPLTFILPEDRTPLEKLLSNSNGQESPSVHEFRILTKSASTKWVIAKIAAWNMVAS